MTPVQTIYNAFLSKMTEDEWAEWLVAEMELDLFILLQGALPQFKFPRKKIEIVTDEEGNIVFSEDLDNEEIQIIASYMKCEWLNRTILSWENLKPLYSERDFSPANMLKELETVLENNIRRAERLESKYYRSISGTPFDYSKLAGV